MKKVSSILIIGFLVISSFGALAANNNSKTTLIKVENSEISISKVQLEQNNNGYLEVQLEGVSTYLMTPGEPMLPKVVQTIELPFGVKNVDVQITPAKLQEKTITYEVKPAPVHLPLVEASVTIPKDTEKKSEIYQSNEPYPNTWYTYDVRCGLNKNLEIKTHVNIQVYPVQYTPGENKLHIAQDADITLTYELPDDNPFVENAVYDMVIIAPSKFERYLDDLIEHKNSFGVQTKLVTTEQIYKDYDGADKPEKIKYFIKDAIETWKIKYVLLVGGLNNVIWAKPRDDCNQGSKAWYVPVRYNNLYDDPEHPLSSSIHDPGVITDLYYADIYEKEGGFSSWDPSGDGIYAAWRKPGIENDTGIDMEPDVIVGRLACRSIKEVKDVVAKIIKYEKQPADPEWFERVLSVSGDGFLDVNEKELDFLWNTSGLEEGVYLINAQSSYINELGIREYGPIETINIKIDRDVETSLKINHDDNTRVPGYPGPYEYPAPPIAEVVTVKSGDVLGNTDFFYSPKEGEAYCNEFNGWADINYTDEILHIRGKSYNPRPYGVYTDMHVWVESENYELVFNDWRYNTTMYYEGEWVAGNKEIVEGEGGGALYYMDGFEKKYLWASNGQISNKDDLISEFSKGYGFVFMSGHGSPNTWGDHFPGVPGNRDGASFTGLTVSSIRPWKPFFKIPVFPMNTLDNKGKPSVVLIGGCHNSQFNVSMVEGILDGLPYTFENFPERNMWCHGFAVPECFSWYMVKLKDRGAIATIGNTGLGYGILGEDCLIGGLDGGICIMFFKQYGENGYHVLGDAYVQTQIEYIDTFDMHEDDHIKSLHQWVLLGDPSLMIGGYPED